MLDLNQEIARLNTIERIRAAEADALAADGQPAGTVLLRILVYAIALALFLLLGWLTDRLLSPGPPAPPAAPGRHRLAVGLRRLADRLEPAGHRYQNATPRLLDTPQ